MAKQSLKEKTAEGLIWGGLNNGIQQILNLIFGIFLARILSPADYGMVGMLAIFSAMASALQESGFTAALANKKEVTSKDYNAVFWFSTIMGLSLYLILFFCAPLIAEFYHQAELISLSRFLFLGFLLSSTGIAHHAVIYRNLLIKQKATSQMTALVISGVTGVTMAFNGMAYWGIAIQSVLYVAITNALYWYFSKWKPSFLIDFSPLKGMFLFSSKLLLTNLFNVANNNIFSVLLGRFYTTAEVGFYSQASKWHLMGYSMINNTINGISQPIFAKVSSEKERQLRVFRKMLRFTAFLSFPCMLGLAFVSKELIIITITDKWLPCVPILQILCVWGAFYPISSLYSNLLISKGKSNIYMWNTILLGALQIITMMVCCRLGILIMLYVFVFVNISWLAFWHYFVHKEIGLRWFQSICDVLPFILAGGLSILLSYWLTLSINQSILLILCKIAIAVAVYCSIMIVFRVKVFKECLNYLLSKLNRKP